MVIDCKYPIYYKFNNFFFYDCRYDDCTLKKKVLAYGEDSCLWVCLRYKVAPLRCLGILGSGKVKKRSCNLKHYEIEKFVADSTLTQFL